MLGRELAQEVDSGGGALLSCPAAASEETAVLDVTGVTGLAGVRGEVGLVQDILAEIRQRATDVTEDSWMYEKERFGKIET